MEDVRKNLNINDIAIAVGSLAFLRYAIRDELGKPTTDVSQWNVASVGDRARVKL